MVKGLLGATTCVLLVNESLAAALQYVTLPPHEARRFMVVDYGASHLTVGLFEFAQEKGANPPRDAGMALSELCSSTNVFAGGDEMVHRLMLWCVSAARPSYALRFI